MRDKKIKIIKKQFYDRQLVSYIILYYRETNTTNAGETTS